MALCAQFKLNWPFNLFNLNGSSNISAANINHSGNWMNALLGVSIIRCTHGLQWTCFCTFVFVISTVEFPVSLYLDIVHYHSVPVTIGTMQRQSVVYATATQHSINVGSRLSYLARKGMQHNSVRSWTSFPGTHCRVSVIHWSSCILIGPFIIST